MLKPGGSLVVSSMKPDSDISTIFTNYIRKVMTPRCSDEDEKAVDAGPSAARAMPNEAASLFELEEDGFFKFYTAEELTNLLSSCRIRRNQGASVSGKPCPGQRCGCKKKIDN